MVFKIVRAGRTIASLRRAVEEENDISSYIEKREERLSRHPLAEDVEVLNSYVEWLRFSRPASLYFDPPPMEEPVEPPVAPRRTMLPVARVSDLLAMPERWADRHVIIEGGGISFFNRNKQGEHWHVFDDGTGKIVAVAKEPMDGRGTLFAVARRTSVGRQLFLELRNFHVKS